MLSAGVASADSYGNLDPFEIWSIMTPELVYGVQVEIPVDLQIQSFGLMYGHEDTAPDPAPANGRFGLYSSGTDGMPETLMAQTDGIYCDSQTTYDNIAFTTTPVIPAGTYWMMGLYDAEANPRMTLEDDDSLYVLWFVNYDDGMPEVAPENPNTYTGQDMNYWINGVTSVATEQSTLSDVKSLFR